MQTFCKQASFRGWQFALSLGVLALTGLTAHVTYAAPANDNWINAQVLTSVWGSVSNNTTGATGEFGEPSHAGYPATDSIWYQWTAPQDGEVSLDTLGNKTDTLLAVYTGPAVNSLRQVAANDDLFPFTQTTISGQDIYNQPYNGPSGLRFNAKAGTNYYFAVATKFASGPVNLSWAYHSAGIFRFATEDAVTTFTINTNGPFPIFQLVTTPVFKASEMESIPDDGSTTQSYYDFGVPGVLVTVTRMGGSSGRMLVDYTTADVGTPLAGDAAALPGLDYTPVQGTLVFDDFEMTKRIVIPIQWDGYLVQSNRDFAVVLSNPRADVAESPEVSPPRVDGAYGRAIVKILDADIDPVMAWNFQPDPTDTNVPPIAPPIFQPTNALFNFGRVAYRTPEDINGYYNLRIWVYRFGTNNDTVTVHYRVNNFLGAGDEGGVNAAEEDNNSFPLQPGSDYATPHPTDDEGSDIGIHGRSADFTMGPDYSYPSGGTLQFNQNTAGVAINIGITNDPLTEFNEDFHIFLWRKLTVNGRERTVLCGTINEANLTILFDDQDPPAGSVDQLYNADYGASMAPPLTTVPPNMAHPGADNSVYGLVVQADNKTVIAGDFLSYNAVGRGRIARVNLDGSLDTSFNPGSGANDFIGAIAPAPAGQFVIGGGFGSYNGTQRVRVARINANGSLDNSFNPGLGANGSIWAVAVQTDGKVIIGGEFSSVGGLARANVARLNANGTVDATFDPGVNGPNGIVWSVAIQSDGKVLLGGEFTSIDGVELGGIARLNADGTRDATFNPGAGTDGYVYAVAVQPDGKILVGGDYSSFDFSPRKSLARLNANGSLDGSFDPASGGSDGAIYSILPSADGIYVGGIFDSYNGTHRRSLVRLFPDGTVDTSFMDTAYNQFAGLHRSRFVDPKGAIYGLGVQSDGNVMIGGSFDKVGGGQADLQVRPDTADVNLWTERKARDGIRNRNNLARLVGGSTAGPGNISITAPVQTAQENQSSLTVALTRANGTLGYLSANFEVEEGLAQAGSDYIYNAVPPIYLSSWELTYPASLPNSTTRMHSDGLFGDSLIPTDLYGNNWYNYTPGQLVVTINNDFQTQGDRNTTFRLSNPTAADQFYLGGENIPLGGALGFAQAPFTIYDDDQQIGVLGFASVNYVVNENVGNAVVTVIRTNGSYGTVSCQYTTLNITGPTNATQNVDYTPKTGTITFANGQTNRTFTIPIANDTTVEPDETITIRLYSPITGGATFGLTNAVVTIIDNDTPGGKLNFTSPTFSTNESAGAALITVTRSGSSAGALSVYAIATNGTAVSGADFLGVTNLLSWADGDVTPKTFFVPLLDDQVVEPDESVTLRLLSPTLNGVTNPPSLGVTTNATLVILNDDFLGKVAYSTSTYSANENGGPAIITVVRPGGSAESIAVSFAASGGSAVSGVDFTPTNGTLSFGPGEVSKSFTVPILNNPFPDAPRFVTLSLLNATPSGTLGSPSSALINIIDDESVNEPPGGSDTGFTGSGMNAAVLALGIQSDGQLLAAGEFTTANQVPALRLVRLSGLSGAVDNSFLSSANAPVQTLAIQTDGRTVVGGAFTAINGVVRNHIARVMSNGAVDSSFNPGSGADNTVFAVAETFVGGERKAFAGGSFATFNGTGRNGIVRINGNGTLDPAFNPGAGVSGVVYALAVYPTNSTQAGKVLIGGDFNQYDGVGRSGVARLNSDGTLDLTFNPGAGADSAVRALAIQTDGRILVGGSFTNFNGSALNRLARLNDNGSLDATFNAGPGADDTVLTLSVQADTKIVVGGLFTHCNGVNRSRITRLNNTGTADPTINFGAGANDFVAATLVQPDGKIVLGGGFTEYDGAAHQRLARIYGGSVAGSGTFEFTSATYEVSELETNAVITVRRRGGTSGLTPGGSISINAATSNGTATNGLHYLGSTNVLVFPESEVFQKFNVPIIPNFEVNDDRTVNLALSNIQPPGSAAIGNQPTAILTIINDDSAISFSSPTFSRIENAPDGQATISIVRSGSTAGPASVNFTTTTNGTATAGLDFTPVTNLVSFAPGDIVKTVTIPIVNDSLIEGNETVTMELTNVIGAFLLAPSTATLTIVDDDLGPGQIMFALTNTPAGEASGNAVVNLVRTNGSAGAVSVRVYTGDITASAGLDYTALNNVAVTFGDGETNKSVLIPIVNDSFVEGDETFSVTLTNFTGGATLLGPRTAIVTIVDNDVGFSFASPSYFVSEAGPTVTIQVLRIGGSNGVASVRYDTTNVTATAGSDFVGINNGLLTFANGETLKSFTVSIMEDTVVEGDETFAAVLSNPSPGVQLLTSSTTVSILDNDTGFSLSTNSYVVAESGTNLAVTVFRTNANTGPVSVSLTTSDGTATVGLDYGAVGGSLNFTNGEALKVVLIPIINDTLPEGDETFNLTLSGPSAGAQLVGTTTATATIIDNDSGVRFSSPTYAVSEIGVSATITVVRENTLTNTVAVNYSTSDGTATNTADYLSASGTLVFTNGETSKSFNVQIIDDTLVEGAETILLSLSSPTGQVSIVNPGAAVLTIVDNDGGSILPAGSLITAENGIVNGAVDPGETVSMLIALRNASGVNTTNLVATLLATNGVTSPSSSQNYGALVDGGASVSRPFTFTANATNGSVIAATFLVAEQGGGQDYGRSIFSFQLGSGSAVFSNNAAITILDFTNASPYPSSISVTGLVGTVSKAVATVSNLYHPSPDDIDMLLAGPTGAATPLMSDAGGGNFITNVTLTFDDAAASYLPDSTLITSGTNKPTNYLLADFFPDPAPQPSGSTLATFNGTDPNGLWSLYIVDDLQIFSGAIKSGWSLSITTLGTIASATDLSVKMSATPNPVVVGSNLTFSVSVTNHGPWNATGIKLTNALPAGATFVSATPSVGTISTNSGAVVWTVGDLLKDASATATIVVRAGVVGVAVSTSSALGSQGDPNPGNNTVSVTNTVAAPTADLVLGVVDSPDPIFIATNNNLTYTITVNNAGPATATGVGVTNTLPAGVAFLSANPSGYTVVGSVVTFTNLGNVGSGAQVVATIVARVTTPATLTNTTICGSGVTDPLKGNNTVSVKTVVEFPHVSFVQSGNNLVISWPADATAYTLERATSLAPPDWTPLTVPAPVTVGDQKTVTLPIGTGSEFFRLRATAP